MSFTQEKHDAGLFVSFMRQVDIDIGKGGCWIWRGRSGDGRYGAFCCEGKSVRAHRWIYEKVCGSIPKGLVLRHKCDRPKCVNPAHLEPGTNAQNTQDAIERGRWSERQGEKHPLAVLGEDDVREIRRLACCGETQKKIAARYEISSQHVGKIIRRECWGHI